MLGIVKRNFIYLTPDSFVVLYKSMICLCIVQFYLANKVSSSSSSSMIRSHLEYAETLVCGILDHHQSFN